MINFVYFYMKFDKMKARGGKKRGKKKERERKKKGERKGKRKE